MQTLVVILLIAAFIGEVVAAIKLRDRYYTWMPFFVGIVSPAVAFLLATLVDLHGDRGARLVTAVVMVVVVTGVTFLIRPKNMRRKPTDIAPEQ